MAWNRRPFRSFKRRFNSQPLAHKKLLWCTTRFTQAETNGVTTSIVLLAPSQWIENSSSGNFEKAKLVRLILALTAGPQASGTTNASRFYNLTVDDSQDTQADPSLQASYSDSQPFWTGLIALPPNANTATPLFNGWPDGVRQFKLGKGRKLSSQSSLFLNISPSAGAADVVTYSGLARMLLMLD